MKTCIPLAALLIPLVLTSCEKVFFQPEPADDPVSVFEELWQDFNDHYAIFEQRNVDWNVQYQIFRPQVSGQTTEDELFSLLGEMLSVLDDGHVNLSAPGRLVFRSNRIWNESIDKDLFDIGVIRDHYLQPDYTTGPDNAYTYGLLSNDIPYIHFTWIDGSFSAIREVLEKYGSKNGLILDMRHNQGGDFTYAFSEMGRFTTEKRLVFTSRTKNGPGPEDFTSWYDWYIEPEGDLFNKKIVVLTDRYTISAGERTVMAFQSLPNSVIMGDTTCGAHSTLIARELANGWHYSISPQQVKLFDGISYEGIGLIPEIYIKNTMGEMDAGIDRTLEEAMLQF